MAEPHLSSSNGERSDAGSPLSLDRAAEQLAGALPAKLERADQIESETDAEPTPVEPARTLPRFREPVSEVGPLPWASATRPDLPSPNGTRPAPDSLVTLDQRKEMLDEMLRQKVGQGYKIESQTDTDAVLVTRGPRRWFGAFGSAAESRVTTSIDEHGQVKTRRL